MSRTRRLVRAVTLPAVLVVAWVLATNVGRNVYLSTPQQIFERARQWWPIGWWHDLVPSVGTILLGFVLSVVVGSIVGALLGTSATARAVVTPVIDFVRSIPMAALVPMLLLVVGFAGRTRVLIVFLGTVWPILLGAMDGVLAIEPRLHDVARSYRLGRVTKLARLTVPASSPHVLAGMRVALGIAVIVVVISEMFGSTAGMGHFVIASQQSFDIPGVWLGTIVFGLLGYLLNLLFHLLHRRLLRWHPSFLTSP